MAIITGGNRGIGLHVVHKLLSCHIKVIMGVRNVEASKKAVFAVIPEEIRRDLLSFESLDTGDLKSVKEFATKIKAQHPKIDILINNGEKDASSSEPHSSIAFCYFSGNHGCSI